MGKTVTHVVFVVLLALGTELDFAVVAASDFIFVLTDVTLAGLDADLFKLRWIDEVLVDRGITRAALKAGRAVHGFVKGFSQVVFKMMRMMNSLRLKKSD